MQGHDNTGQPGSIGPYRIVEPLGEGGMAVVYLAEQTEPVTRRVALKILKPGMDSKQIVARFESERQVLALLDHPNIAKIHDGGLAANGRPYFVMELVDGLPITDYCDQQGMNTTARVRLFVQVCRAVQHAHLKGLIHRDLKPSNVLVGDVDGVPQVKVIDFGIAKATAAPLTDETRLETRIGQLVGTPQYMSPEQTGLAGTDIDTRADIYSLGAVLYELLVGALPLDLSSVRDIALPAVIRDKVPPTPSARFTSLDSTRDQVAAARDTNAQDLVRALQGDLDWIVMKAIEKDRNRRYETANALALDCERYLAREPVLARPPSKSYLMQRFVQRNRAAVAAAVVALLAVLGGSVAATVGYLRAVEAEQIAQQEAEAATQVADFLVGLFEVSDPSAAQGNNVSAREVLDRGVESIATQLADQPEVQARLQTTMGGVYRNLGLLKEAEALFRLALDTRTNLLGPDHPHTLTAANWLAIAILEQGRLDEATPMHEDTLERRRRVLGDRHKDTLTSIHNLASLYRFNARPADAEPLFREALAGQREVLGNEHEMTLLTLSILGALYSESGRFDEAMPLLQESVDTHRRIFGPDFPQTTLAINNLADLYFRMGRYEEARPLNETVLEVRKRVLGENNAQTLWSKDRLAGVYAALGRMEEAEELQHAAAEGLRRVYGDEHPDTLAAINNLAEFYRAKERYDEAEPLYVEVLQVQSRNAPDHMGTGVTNHNLAALYNSTYRYAEAIALFEEAERIWEPLVPQDHLYRRENTRLWAEAMRSAGDAAGAAALEARMLPIAKRSTSVD